MKILILYISLFLFCLNLTGQQDQLLTQFPYTKLLVNPALAGENDFTRITAIHRDQWIGIQGAPTGQLLSINLPKVANRLGFAVSLSRQSVGIQEKLDLTGMYAYKVRIGKATASLAMQLSGRRFINDFTKDGLIAIDGFELDPSIDRIRYSQTIFNVGIGTHVNTDDFYIGISIPRLAKADLDFEIGGSKSTEVRHLYAMAGLYLGLSSNLEFRPQILFKLAENAPNDLDILASFVYDKNIHLGANLSMGGDQDSFLESVDLLFGLQISESVFASVAFDFTLSQIRQFENGGFEILLRYDFVKYSKPKEMISPRYF